MVASQHYDLQPDLMPIAKGMTSGYLPMGGVIVSDRVAETMIEHGGEFYHGYTYSGHPASAAVGLENLRIMRDEKIVDYVRNEAAPYLQDKIAGLAAHRLVGEVRGVGLLGAIELVKDKATRERFPDKGTVGTLCRDLCVANGLVMRAVGDTMINVAAADHQPRRNRRTGRQGLEGAGSGSRATGRPDRPESDQRLCWPCRVPFSLTEMAPMPTPRFQTMDGELKR